MYLKVLNEYNKNAKHQQDLIQYEGGVSRCLCTGTHGSAPHLTKTLIRKKDNIMDNNSKYAIRKLCPDETSMLMGMTMDDVAKCRAVSIADSQLYKQHGNGLICNHVQYIAEHMYKAFVNPKIETTDERMVRLGYGVSK